ncbi:hypothetical protein FOZ61_002459 [Perkinsus olseni]|uniref:Uncharacterized protein n=1 Tax=Perkinsus olseni TaxID=32597 RepID=A0A7J6LIM6_PEROL|nr:hypothetical protein FOL46_006709 [Perkinsus olseni]KAF4662433.1 hypothetical protein FOZ61_002459 [Perkinsus olseni]
MFTPNAEKTVEGQQQEAPISMEDLQEGTPVQSKGNRRCLELDSDALVFDGDDDESRDVLSPLGQDHHQPSHDFPTATFAHGGAGVMITPKESSSKVDHHGEVESGAKDTPGDGGGDHSMFTALLTPGGGNEKEGDISNGSTAVGVTPTPKKESLTSPPSTPARAQTLVIFDWDDTICPTTWAKVNGLNVCDPFVPEQFIDPLAELAEMAAKMIRVAASLGKVVIVTNAQDGWFELSCRKWLPSLEPLFQNLAVQICSARSAFEHRGIKSPAGWKAHAFRDIIDGQRCATPISGVDLQLVEEPSSAAVNFWNSSAMHRMKSVKFLLKPDLTQLGNEIQLLTDSLEHIVKHDGALDLELLTNEATPPEVAEPIGGEEGRSEAMQECENS